MNKDSIEFDKIEQIFHEVIGIVLLTCESQLAKNDDKIEALPYAAMAVKESLLTFLALVDPK